MCSRPSWLSRILNEKAYLRSWMRQVSSGRRSGTVAPVNRWRANFWSWSDGPSSSGWAGKPLTGCKPHWDVFQKSALLRRKE